MKVTVEIPDETAQALGLTPETAARTLLEDAVAQAYREGKIGNKILRQVLGLSWHEKEAFLLRQKIYHDLTAEEIRSDIETLHRLHEKKSLEIAAA
jgi:hypothetical protein